MAAPSSTVNFATKMIADIRSDMNAQALANNLPVPTDAQVESEVDKAFDKIKNKPYGDFVLREFKDWWLVDGPVFSAPPKPPPVIPPISLITRPSNLMLSSTAPSVVGGIFFQPHSITTLQGNLALSSVAPIFNPLPGQPGNSVGFAAAPGYPGSLTAASGPLTSGSSGNPTVYSFKDFTGLSIDANWVTFIGCRFKSNVVADNNVSTGGTGAQNIVFSYCSFTPLNSLYGSPPGAAWPSAGAGLQTTTFVTDVNCIDGNSGYQFGLTVRNATDGPITFDHCDIWGFGNALNFPAPTTAQITVQDCWIHDAANASPQSYHTDGPGYLDGGTPPRNITIDHCTIASIGTTNALAFQAATSAYINIHVTRNFFSGFNVCIDMCHDVASSTGLIFSDNIIGTDLPWVNGPISGAAMFISNGSPTNVWRRNKFKVLPGTSTIAGQQFSWVSGDDGKYMLPNGTLSATDYAG